jgi:tetratricopeptide (TPR) repeat protein
MSLPSSNAMLMSPHRDVLEASPDTDDSKARLVEELQARGRAAVGAKSWMDARLLYEKALTIEGCSAVDGSRRAALSSNLSLVERNMGRMEEARGAAERATREDPAYVKGWWRLGQALIGLHRYGEARGALARAAELEPSNKALARELDKVQKQVEEEEEEAALMAMAVDSNNGAAVTSSTADAPPPGSAPTTAAKAKTTTTISSSGSTSSIGDAGEAKMDIVDDDDARLFKKSEPIRGYKVVNGKKTSYFHNELDEKAKALIGDIAPKKLDNPSPPSTLPVEDGGSKTSAWNQAGTWEERDVTQWAKDTLARSLLSTTYTLPASSPAPNALVRVSRVTKLDGHASVAVVRGKVRFIYEFLLKLDWQLDKEDDDLECKGSLAIPDIDGTIALGEGYEIHDFVIDEVSHSSVKPIVDRFVQRGGFHDALNESIDDWVRLLKKEYGGESKA